MRKQQFKEWGKKGSDKRYATRYEILVELSKHYSKEEQNFIMKWPTKYLVELLKVVQKI